MNNETKQKLLSFLSSHNDGSKETAALIEAMKKECTYAHFSAFDVSTDDLQNFPNQPKLRTALGKKDDDTFTMHDCETVAKTMTDMLAEEFQENIGFVLRFLPHANLQQ